MASVNISEFHDICRICGNKTSVLMGLHIFEREGELRQIQKKIVECLPIKVSHNDILPKMVCEECVYKLDLLHDFRENSLKTDAILNDIVKGLPSNQNLDKDLKSTDVITPLDLPEKIDKTCDSKLGIVARESSPPAAASLLNTPPPPAPPSATTLIISNVHSMPHNLKNEPDILVKVEEMATTSIIESSHCEHNITSETTSDLESVSCCDSEDFSNAINSTRSDLQEQPRDALVIDMKQSPEKIITTPSFAESNEFLVQMPPEQTAAWFFCNICGKTYSSKEEFNVHYEVHWNKCHDCGAIFTDEEALVAHRRQVHTKKTDAADDGKLGEEEEEEQEEGDGGSKKAAAGTKPCPVCGKMYRTNYKLKEHMRRHTGEKPFKCNSCDKAFRSKIGLAQHEAQHTGQYEYTCQLCGKGFQCKSYLAVHQRVHNDNKPYTCSKCAKQFKTKQSLLDHENRHLGVKPYLCETCGRGFITKGLCKSHQRVHSGGDNRQHPCPVCHKLFVSKSYLATHARIHTGEKPFICEVCGKGFLTRVDLRIHSTVHTGEKSYMCEVCGKAFARRDALRCHRRCHTGERPYRCDVCGQSFTQFSPMVIHRRLHTGERPYACDICAATFVSRSTMLAHRKKHAADTKPPPTTTTTS